MQSRSPFGENIYSVQCSDPNIIVPVREVISKWYSEKKNHKYGIEPKVLNTCMLFLMFFFFFLSNMRIRKKIYIIYKILYLYNYRLSFQVILRKLFGKIQLKWESQWQRKMVRALLLRVIIRGVI